MKLSLYVFATITLIARHSYGLVGSLESGAQLYESATEIVLVEDSNVKLQQVPEGCAFQFTPSSQIVIKGVDLPASFTVKAPSEMIYSAAYNAHPPGRFYALLLLRPSNEDITNVFVFAGTLPEQMYFEPILLEPSAKIGSFAEVVATMLSSDAAHVRNQGLLLAGGIKDAKVVDLLVAIARNGNIPEKGFAYKALIESGRSDFVTDFLTYLDKAGESLDPGNYISIKSVLAKAKDDDALRAMGVSLVTANPKLRETLFKTLFAIDPEERLRKAGRLLAKNEDTKALQEISSLLNQQPPTEVNLVLAQVNWWRSMFATYHLGPKKLWSE